MLDVDKLATLHVVLVCGSFSAAAQTLHLTQPAVSRQVSLLERRLGVELVRRTQRGVYPTEAGKLLATHAEAVIDRLERAEAELAEFAGLRHGTIRLGAFFTAMVYLSAEVAMALGEQHPGLRIIDDLVDRGEALRRLARGQLDVAIVFEHDFEPKPVSDGIEVITLFDDPVCVLLPTEHPLAARRKLRLDDLRNETWIRAHDGSLARLTDHLIGTNGMAPRLLLAGHGEEPIEAQALVAAGRGITLAHDLNVIVNPDQIAVRPLLGRRSVRHIQAAYLPGHRSPAITAALEALQHIGRRRRTVRTADKTAAPAKREPTG
jgi:DNA-binding transcriptional LysR family regulator